ncbi:hypothetical protein ACN28I_20665 [Archangium gephyra]|uniref:hypothetical protein n=1 Tax=Archangium gephyra TaxID=48 RepID=UPI003B7F1947
MSGEAGAQLDSEYYALFVGSGVRVSYALPPGGDGTEIGRHFQEESAPYARWLERARPALDGFFARLATEQRIPLVHLSEPSEEIHGIIIEDVDPSLADTGAEQHFREHSRGLPCPVSLNGSRRLPAPQSIQLRFLVSARVRRSALEPVLEGVVDILLRTRGGM